MKFAVNPGPPRPDEYAEYYHQYLQTALDVSDIAEALRGQIAELKQLVDSTPADELTKVHPPYTWTVTQAIGHLVDQERIFGNRAARFASGDQTPLPGYDQALIANNAGYHRCSAEQLLTELEHLRCSNLLLFSRLDEQQWSFAGIADDRRLSVRSIAYLLVGHMDYHVRIFRQRLSGRGPNPDKPRGD